MRALKRYCSRRAIIAGLAIVSALAVQLFRPPVGEHSEPGIVQMLAQATGARVEPDSFVWERSQGSLRDLWLGRAVLFVAVPPKQEHRDIYRAWVRLTPGGKPVSVRTTRNLSETPLGDDAGLVLRGTHAAYATAAFGRVQSVSVLDLTGISASSLPPSFGQRLLTRITALQHDGASEGVGRTDLVLRAPPRGVRLRLSERELSVWSSTREASFKYDLAARRLIADSEGAEAPVARAVVQKYGSKALVLWAVDTVRAEVGPEPIA